MKPTKKPTIFSVVILFFLILLLVFPNSVLADDTTPPPADTPVVMPPTEAPIATEAPVTEEPTATQAPILEEPMATAAPVTEVSVTEEESSEEDANLTELVQQLDDADLVLLDENGQTIPLASNQAADALTAPDPIGCPPGVKPLAWGGTGIGCTISYTSIQAALNDPLVTDNWTIYVEAGIYHEQALAQTPQSLMAPRGHRARVILVSRLVPRVYR
jgi:hypothetical protein